MRTLWNYYLWGYCLFMRKNIAIVKPSRSTGGVGHNKTISNEPVTVFENYCKQNIDTLLIKKCIPVIQPFPVSKSYNPISII